MDNKIKYLEICNIDNFVVNIAYYFHPTWFEIDNNTMKEWNDYKCLKDGCSNVPYDFEILETFIQNYKIVNINWIDCNYTWGLLNHDTGKWTGLVGLVKFEKQKTPIIR